MFFTILTAISKKCIYLRNTAILLEEMKITTLQ